MKQILITVAITTVALTIAMVIYNKFLADKINMLEADEGAYIVG